MSHAAQAAQDINFFNLILKFYIIYYTYIKSQLYLHFLFVYKNSNDKLLFRKDNKIIYETKFFRSIKMRVKLLLSDHPNIANYHNILIMLKRII